MNVAFISAWGLGAKSLGVRVGAVAASTVLIAASVWLERGETGQAMFSSLTTVGD